jgi:antirestriction protein
MEKEPITRSGGGNEEQQSEERPEKDRGESPRIYAASLSDYNAGNLHGAWLNAAVGDEELEASIAAMLAASPTPGAEEWAIHDYEGFGPLRLGEYESLSTVTTVANGIAEHGQAFAHWSALIGTSDLEAIRAFEDVYRGHWESVEEFAGNHLDDMGANVFIYEAVPDYLQPYIKLDVEGFARDLELGGDITTSDGDGGVYIFDGST